jgi:hypothetical protein
MASLNVTTIVAARETPVAAFAGSKLTIVGGVVSGAGAVPPSPPPPPHAEARMARASASVVRAGVGVMASVCCAEWRR